ncbi:hypothetical protein GCK72_018032 [Caenorhabditis remanei]|uniref:Uncharacterized protein n=1 Tax=Caenorhabditis remanei TaxID=31234 RepID=E3LPJ1_CAERE|nr:hypothetical protein GCK72_018032 [Caenorhabditis remanei]EFP05369.1 hypothetical protein CRE_27297 [Caenorhabditis remanei]KAF1751478.1 hypothetical protein GCK72_018032 [Caenorhabditis remanei]
MTTNCMVCDGSAAQYHFGANVCRACAAFFRRYVNTKKLTILCNCLSKKESQYPCRLCRMKKCIAVGMERSKVQGPRDMNNPLKRKMIEGSSPSPSSSSSPDSTISQIEFGITLRSVELINLIAKNYKNLEMTRSTIFDLSNQKSTLCVNLYELSLEVKTDAKLLWKLCETSFPEFDRLNRNDKKTLFFNFYAKWSIFEVAMFSAKRNDPHNFYSPSGAIATSINDFYVNTVREKSVLSDEEIIRIFEPFWTYHFQNVISPVVKLRFGEMEYMALLGIMLWDAGYANISNELAEVCHSMRKIILRELNAHFAENEISSNRLFETWDTLNLLERAEHKCQEEIELCGVYNFEVDEDMRNMIMWDKY